MRWKILTVNNCCEELRTIDPQHRNTWRIGVRSAMQQLASYTWRGPSDASDCTCMLMNNQNLDDDDDDDDDVDDDGDDDDE